MTRSADWIKRISDNYIDVRELLGATLSSLPCVLLSLYYKDTSWLTIGLISTSLYLTQAKLRWGLLSIVTHWAIIIASISIIFYSIPHPWLFALITALLSGGCIALSYWGRAFRSLGSWIVIPSVYIACELNVWGGTSRFVDIICNSPVALLGPFLVTLICCRSWRGIGIKFGSVDSTTVVFPMVCGVFIAVFLSALLVDLFSVAHSEWMIWSVVSVSTGEVQSMYQKLSDRVKGAFLGCTAGVIILILLQPQGSYIASVAAYLIPLTLVIRNYPLSFFCRCMLIVLTNAIPSQGEIIALHRILNVFLGGVTGAAIGRYFIKKSYTMYKVLK